MFSPLVLALSPHFFGVGAKALALLFSTLALLCGGLSRGFGMFDMFYSHLVALAHFTMTQCHTYLLQWRFCC